MSLYRLIQGVFFPTEMLLTLCLRFYVPGPYSQKQLQVVVVDGHLLVWANTTIQPSKLPFFSSFFFFLEQHANSVIFLSIGCKIPWKVGGRGDVLQLSKLYEDILLVIEMS